MSDTTGKFVNLWRKYRPVTLTMMINASKNGDQSYLLSNHEFQDISTQKSGHSFKLSFYKGQSETGIVRSLNARDLLKVLKSSEKANELSLEGIYEFELDRKFVLHCRHKPVAEGNE